MLGRRNGVGARVSSWIASKIRARSSASRGRRRCIGMAVFGHGRADVISDRDKCADLAEKVKKGATVNENQKTSEENGEEVDEGMS